MDEPSLLKPKLTRLKLSGITQTLSMRRAQSASHNGGTSARRGVLVHRAVKIVIEGRSLRVDTFVKCSKSCTSSKSPELRDEH